MAPFRDRIPRRRDLILIFLVCIFPNHAWTILAFLRELPSYLMRLNPWEIASIFAYSQTLTLLESLILSLVVTTLAILLPGYFIRDMFIPQAGILALLISLWTAFIHYQNSIAAVLSLSDKYLLMAWLLSFISVLAMLSVLLRKSSKFETVVVKFLESLGVLSAIYLSIDIISLIILLFRVVSVTRL